MNPTMELLTTIAVVATALGTALVGVLSMKVRVEIAEWKENAYAQRDKDAKDREEDKEQFRAWINGSFMRANEVRATLGEHKERVSGIDNRLKVVEAVVRRYHPKQ